MWGRKRKARSQSYHDQVKATLDAAGMTKQENVVHAPGSGYDQELDAQIAQDVFTHEVRRHTNRKGRVVR